MFPKMNNHSPDHPYAQSSYTFVQPATSSSPVLGSSDSYMRGEEMDFVGNSPATHQNSTDSSNLPLSIEKAVQYIPMASNPRTRDIVADLPNIEIIPESQFKTFSPQHPDYAVLAPMLDPTNQENIGDNSFVQTQWNSIAPLLQAADTSYFAFKQVPAILPPSQKPDTFSPHMVKHAPLVESTYVLTNTINGISDRPNSQGQSRATRQIQAQEEIESLVNNTLKTTESLPGHLYPWQPPVFAKREAYTPSISRTSSAPPGSSSASPINNSINYQQLPLKQLSTPIHTPKKKKEKLPKSASSKIQKSSLANQTAIGSLKRKADVFAQLDPFSSFISSGSASPIPVAKKAKKKGQTHISPFTLGVENPPFTTFPQEQIPFSSFKSGQQKEMEMPVYLHGQQVLKDIEMTSPSLNGNEVETNQALAERKRRKESSSRESRSIEAMIAIEKLGDFLQALFEAEDSLTPDTSSQNLVTSTLASSSSALGATYFVPNTTDPPLLNIQTLRKLGVMINKVAEYKALNRIEVEDWGRLMKMLEAAATKGMEGLVLFHVIPGNGETKPLKPQKKKSKKQSTSLTSKKGKKNDLMDEEEGDEAKGNETPIVDSDNHNHSFEDAEEKLSRILNSIEAASLAFEIMTLGDAEHSFSKQLFPEGLLMGSLEIIKGVLSNIIYPLVEASGTVEDDFAVRSQAHQFLDYSTSERKLSSLLSQLPPLLTMFLQKTYDLMQLQDFSDTVVIILSYIGIGPFLVDTSACSGDLRNTLAKGMERLKLAALGLLRNIFVKYPRQRTWVLDEILTGLIGLPTRKRNLRQYQLQDGKAIQMVSALILMLVQSCSEAVLGSVTNGKHSVTNHLLDETTQREGNMEVIWKSGIDVAAQSANYVLKYLVGRCTKSPRSGSSAATNDSEYRAILDNMMEDFVLVLNYPEWPASELFLRVFTRMMVGVIDDNNSANTSKLMAIEWLGAVASRIKRGIVVFEEEDGTESKGLNMDIPKGDITSATTLDQIKNMRRLQRMVIEFLEMGIKDDPSLKSARQYYLCEWGFSLTAVIANIPAQKKNSLKQQTWEEQYEDDENDGTWPAEIREILQTMQHEYHLLSSGEPVFQSDNHVSTPLERSKIVAITELLASRQALCLSFDSMLSRILVSLDSGVVAFRTKGLRALSQIVVSDENVLALVNVRQTVVQRMSDISSAVRDAAIDLVGKYITQKPEIIQVYYKAISERVADTGVNVRKRVIKLLKDIYLKCSDDRATLVDIALNLLFRVLDDDDHVKDLALSTFQDIWFSPFNHGYGAREYAKMSTDEKKEIKERSLVILDVAGKLSPNNAGNVDILGVVIRKVLEASSKKDRNLEICRNIVDFLFDHLLSSEDVNSESGDQKGDVISCINTIHIFSLAAPSVFVAKHITILQPYLKSSKSEGENRSMQLVLMIYQNVLPLMQQSNAEFLHEVQKSLLSLVTKCKAEVLIVLIPCLCSIIDKLTFNYKQLEKLLTSCCDILTKEKKRLTEGQGLSKEPDQIRRLLMIIGLLCQNVDFDKRRTEIPENFPELTKNYKGVVIVSFIFELTYSFAVNDCSNDEQVNTMMRVSSLQCLGYIFSSHPTLMINPLSTELMDQIFENGTEAAKKRLMRVFLEFLTNEQKKIDQLESKKKEKNAGVDIKVLIGNSEEFADASVGSSVMQRYLDRILSSALDTNSVLRTNAFDVIGMIVRQGLAHPILCMPTIVAMETSPEDQVRDKAYKLHVRLNEKHASIIHTRNIDCVKKAYMYQQQLAAGLHPVQGYAIRNAEKDAKPEALLDLMYTVLKEKRQRRNEFLMSVTKVSDIDIKKLEYEDDVDISYHRFIADNLATLDYKSIEEILIVIYGINRALSGTGTNLLYYLEHGNSERKTTIAPPPAVDAIEGHLSTLNNEPIEMPKEIDEIIAETENNNDETELNLSPATASKVAICMGILLFLKDHLKRLYGLSEAKCQQFIPSNAGNSKDKPAVRNSRAPFAIIWKEKWRFAETFTDGTDEQAEADRKEACDMFRNLISLDGTGREDYVHIGDDDTLNHGLEGSFSFGYEGEQTESDHLAAIKGPRRRSRSRSGTPAAFRAGAAKKKRRSSIGSGGSGKKKDPEVFGNGEGHYGHIGRKLNGANLQTSDEDEEDEWDGVS